MAKLIVGFVLGAYVATVMLIGYAIISNDLKRLETLDKLKDLEGDAHEGKKI